MNDTLLQENPRSVSGCRMGRKNKKGPTAPIRVYADVAEDLNRFAPIFDQDVADFVDEALRSLIESRRGEATKRISGQPARDRKGKKGEVQAE
jgi:hypothetical protein